MTQYKAENKNKKHNLHIQKSCGVSHTIPNLCSKRSDIYACTGFLKIVTGGRIVHQYVLYKTTRFGTALSGTVENVISTESLIQTTTTRRTPTGYSTRCAEERNTQQKTTASGAGDRRCDAIEEKHVRRENKRLL